ncbi:transposase, partial [Streptomyces canarius]
TDLGPVDRSVEISVPRDRDGSFEPKVAEKRRRRLTGVDEIVLSLSAKGLTTGEVHAHLAEECRVPRSPAGTTSRGTSPARESIPSWWAQAAEPTGDTEHRRNPHRCDDRWNPLPWSSPA